ncbi:MAG TPA: glycosyltransferase family 2 protein [Chloroflexota bacterium]|nr:glycosyltransferase family 2 protein [Chloroflexota bacterium]
MKLLYRPGVARAVAALAVVYLVAYLWWRGTASLNPASPIFSIVVLAAEAFGAVSFILFVLMAWDTKQTAPGQSPPGRSVDVYVLTHDEDLEVLEATLIGCGVLTYPHTTYVLDDGRRPAVAMLVARLGCRYLTRPDASGAWAGNLNAALPRTDGDFLVLLDADTVPQPDFLDRTLGYFVDERVALVQLPPEFYNLDSIQHEARAGGLTPWHDQALFDRVIQPGKNRWNAAVWCGSPSIVRRAALTSIGGVATGTRTAGLPTSVRLQAGGWKTVYHPEALAYGIAPQTLHAFNAQRLRWAEGAMQFLRSRDNPLIVPGLSLAQRLSYLGSVASYLDPYRKLVYLATPVVILATGLSPWRVGAVEFLAHWAPCFALTLLANVALGRGSFDYLRGEKYGVLKLFTFLRGSVRLAWPDRGALRATPRQQVAAVEARERRVVLPHVALLALEVGAGLVGLASLLGAGRTVHPREGDLLLALGWAIANVAVIWLAVNTALRRLYRRQSYRFPVTLTATIATPDSPAQPAAVQDLSLYGVGVVAATALAFGRPCAVTLDLPGGALRVRGEVVNTRGLQDGRCRLGIQFILFSPEERARLIAFLFIIAPRYQRNRAALRFQAKGPSAGPPTARPAPRPVTGPGNATRPATHPRDDARIAGQA